jgi:hypothetical protein
VTITRHEPATCPACGHPIDAAGTPEPGDDYVPAPGDVSICFGCGFVLIFTQNLKLRAPTPDEYLSFPPEQRAELESIQHKIKAIKGVTGEQRPPSI